MTERTTRMRVLRNAGRVGAVALAVLVLGGESWLQARSLGGTAMALYVVLLAIVGTSLLVDVWVRFANRG